jgi:hypothetical protein
MTADDTARPCRYCLAAYPILFENGETDCCEFEHRDDPRVYALARKMARVFNPPTTDEHICWFLADADAVVDDFDPAPGKWRIRRLPDSKGDDFDLRFRLNDVTYVDPAAGKEPTHPVRLTTWREWQREADEAAKEQAR